VSLFGRSRREPDAPPAASPHSNGALPVRPSGSSSIHGRVTTPDGWPLSGSAVTVVSPGGLQIGRTSVDDTGEFTVQVAVTGTVTVIVTAAGADPVARMVTVGPESRSDVGLIVLRNAQRAEMPPPGVWTIDMPHTIIRATARHMGLTRVEGRFTAFYGDVTVARPLERSTVHVTMTAGSIDTGAVDRDIHLRSADFLDVERFPFLTYRSTAVTPVTGEKWRIDGILTIRDIEREVPLDMTYLGAGPDPWGAMRMAFKATTQLALRDYEMHWNLALPDGLVLVGPTLRIDLDVQAILPPESDPTSTNGGLTE
jgi:polyisoprenoid-binding protein YceI